MTGSVASFKQLPDPHDRAGLTQVSRAAAGVLSCSDEAPKCRPRISIAEKMPPMIRTLLAALVLGAALAAPAAAQQRTVNVYNWSDYIDPKVLTDFTKETGIRVVYDTYDNNEIVETKLLAGKSG